MKLLIGYLLKHEDGRFFGGYDLKGDITWIEENPTLVSLRLAQTEVENQKKIGVNVNYCPVYFDWKEDE